MESYRICSLLYSSNISSRSRRGTRTQSYSPSSFSSHRYMGALTLGGTRFRRAFRSSGVSDATFLAFLSTLVSKNLSIFFVQGVFLLATSVDSADLV